MTAVWMGLAQVSDVANKIKIDGDPKIARTMQQWLGLSVFASQSKLIH
jgi:hypothetical protein